MESMESFVYNNKTYSFKDSNLFAEGSLIGEFKSIKEAIEYVVAEKISEELKQKISSEVVQPIKEQITNDSIALVLYENGETKVTQTLIENIKQIIETKLFYPSDSVLQLREMYDDFTVPGKIDYVLMDGSKVMINVDTNHYINSIIDLRESRELIRYMNQNTKNFFEVIDSLLEDNYGN